MRTKLPGRGGFLKENGVAGQTVAWLGSLQCRKMGAIAVTGTPDRDSCRCASHRVTDSVADHHSGEAGKREYEVATTKIFDRDNIHSASANVLDTRLQG